MFENTTINDISYLIRAFKSHDQEIIDEASQRLLSMGEAVIEPLIQALKEPDVDARLPLALTLIESSDARAMKEVLMSTREAMNKNNDSELLFACKVAEELARKGFELDDYSAGAEFNSDSDLSVLLEILLKLPSSERIARANLQAYSQWVLRESAKGKTSSDSVIIENFLNYINDFLYTHSTLVEEAGNTISAIGDPNWFKQAWIMLARHYGVSPEEKKTLSNIELPSLKLLPNYRDRETALTTIISQISNFDMTGNVFYRTVFLRYGIAALGEMKDNRAVDPLLTTLKDAEPSLRMESAEALSKIGDVRAIEPLKAVVMTETDEIVLRTYWQALKVLMS